MKLRSVALALALTFGLTGMAEAKKKAPAYTKHKSPKLAKYKARKANKASKQSLAKRRKGASKISG
jgi:hypothetical protein